MMEDEMRMQIVDGVAIFSDNEIRQGRQIHGHGRITRTWNHHDECVLPSKTMCAGCHDDFYNKQGGMDGQGCWSFKTAVVCNKVGHSSIHVANGPDTKMVKTLSCWHGVCK